MGKPKPTSTASSPGLGVEQWEALLAEERRQSNVVYDPRSPQLRSNPYPLLHLLRETDPVHWSYLLSAWLLTRYQDVLTFLRQPDLSQDSRNARLGPLDNAGLRASVPAKPTLLQLDPPDHTRLRSLISKAFTPKAVEALNLRIQAIADALLQEMPPGKPFDLMQAFAIPVIVMVIAELLGVDPQDREQFKAWSTDLTSGIEASSSDETQMRRATASAELWVYFQRIVEERRQAPHDDMVSALLAVEAEGDRLTEEELMLTCMLLLVAGNETTTNLIGNGMLGLLHHPDQFQLLQKEPARMAQAVEEMLRYDSPVQVQRLVTTEMVIGSKCIEPGTMVITLIGAVNRDPAAFSEPEVFDMTGDGPHHVSFGMAFTIALAPPWRGPRRALPLPRSCASFQVWSLRRSRWLGETHRFSVACRPFHSFQGVDRFRGYTEYGFMLFRP